jgi:hypothetical protein
LKKGKTVFNPHQLKKAREERDEEDIGFIIRPVIKQAETTFSFSLSDESTRALSQVELTTAEVPKRSDLTRSGLAAPQPKVGLSAGRGKLPTSKASLKSLHDTAPKSAAESSESDMDVDTPPPPSMEIDNERQIWEAEVRNIKAQSRPTSSPLPLDPINKLSMYSASLDFCWSSRWSKAGHISSSPEPQPEGCQGTSKVRSRSPHRADPVIVEESDDDMFARTPEAPALETQPKVRGQADDLVDSEGYFMPQIGEVFMNPSSRQAYTVLGILGKGVFSCVVKARNSQGDEVAVKIIRDKDLMLKAGLKEIRVIQMLNSLDPEDHAHIIRFKESFYLNRHLCIVFESLDMNLRDLIKQHSKGLSLEALQSYARQIMTALCLFQRAKLLHCDSKS